jgi:pyrroline-5-carboxylate reductase
VIAFIGGGNMASAIIGGLIRQGHPASQIEVVEPWDEARAALRKSFGIEALPAPAPRWRARASWSGPSSPRPSRTPPRRRAHTQGALHLSVAAGIRSDSIAQWLGSDCIVRTMPNTPALVGKGMSALFARAGVSDAQRQSVEAIMATTGEFCGWRTRSNSMP